MRQARPHVPPELTFVYLVRDAAGQPLYVGVTTHLERRVRQHAETKRWWPIAAAVEASAYRTRRDALDIERIVMADLQPPGNKLVRPPDPRRSPLTPNPRPVGPVMLLTAKTCPCLRQP